MDQVNLRLEHVRLLACTHAHSDHWGQAAPIMRTGRLRAVDAPQPRPRAPRSADDPQAALERRLEVGRQSGVPPRGAGARTPSAAKNFPSGIARVVEPDRALVDGRADRDRPGRVDGVRDARPRAVARLPVSSPSAGSSSPATTSWAGSRCSTTTARRADPVGEFLGSLDKVDVLDARLGAVGARQAVRRRARPHRGQPRAGRRAAGGGPRRPLAARPRPRWRSCPPSTASRVDVRNATGCCPRRSPTCATSSARGASRAEPDGDVERWRAT